MREDLRDAVDGLYRAFSGCPKPLRIEGCPHCHSRGAGQPLLRMPLRRLDEDVLGLYVFSAMHTWGTAADFRYFVPRMLELVAAGSWQRTDLEITFQRLGEAGWRRWPGDEARAVQHVIGLLWDQELSAYPGSYGAGTMLCAVGHALDDLSPLLTRWAAVLDTEAPALHLREFILRNMPTAYPGRRLANAFWRGRDAQVGQVVDWLLSAKLKEAVTDAFLRTSEPAAASALDEIDRFL